MSAPVKPRERSGTGDGFDRKLIAPLVSGAILNPINSTIVSVALVPIGVAFGAPPAETAWLISALYLATAVGQPVVGRLIDIYGPRRLFLPATALVGVAGVIGALAPNLAVLIVARVILGFGTCAGYPAAMRLIRDEGRRTGKDSPAGVLTILAIATQTIAVIGPPLGGLLIGLGGWRATLAVNIPIAIVAFVLGRLRFPRDERAPGKLNLDFPGMTLFATTLVALLLFLMNPDAGSWYLLVITVLAAAAFTVHELRHPRPFIDLRVLGGNVPLLLTYGRALLAYVVSYSFVYGFTQWLEDGRGLSASTTGLLTLPMFAAGIVVSALTGRRQGLRGKLFVAAVAQLAACVLLLALGPASPLWTIVGIVLIFGIPQGLNSLALQNAVYRQANPDDVGASAGLLRTFGYLGAIVSSAAQGGFFGQRADTGGLHHLAWFLVVASVVFLLVNVLDRTLARSTPGERHPEMTEQLDPARTALLVMDYQAGIVSRVADDEALVDRVGTAISDVRAHGGHVGWVRVGFDDAEFDAIPSTSVFARMVTPESRAVMHADAPATQIDERLSPQPQDVSVRKIRVGAFTTTDLDTQLRGRDVDTLVLAGISTSGVVLSTVREAMDRDYRILVLDDASADPEPGTHEFLTGTIFPKFATVLDVDALAKLWA
ncbi:MFS transporter [Amycolatopsis sp. NPDC049253]|uniref:MFS transporter n=1 Tax=Amycolatopsis sp. NPDC049253 TaxID=3155274 RepID=UPI0034388FB0